MLLLSEKCGCSRWENPRVSELSSSPRRQPSLMGVPGRSHQNTWDALSGTAACLGHLAPSYVYQAHLAPVTKSLRVCPFSFHGSIGPPYLIASSFRLEDGVCPLYSPTQPREVGSRLTANHSEARRTVLKASP